MHISFFREMIALFAGIALVVLLTARYRVPAFFALLIACFVTGCGVQLAVPDLINIIKDGFGNIMKSLGLIIVLGTTLGVLLGYTGSTAVMADYIIKKACSKNASWAIGITGFIVGMPVFCDSGFIVLSGLNNSLSKKTGESIIMMSVSLATGLYSVHCLIPPHPGAATAAAVIGADYGKLILYGIIIAVPAMMMGHLWAAYAGKKFKSTGIVMDDVTEMVMERPSVLMAFLPVIVPILLIALRSVFLPGSITMNGLQHLLMVLGDPVIALVVGITLAFATGIKWEKNRVGYLLTESVEKAGGILVIIGAGGAFGAVLAATGIGTQFSGLAVLKTVGMFFPFLITSLLKTAQGSSTVAMITAASIVQPLLPSLGLDTANGKLICVLSMGAGSMMISHANDAYFWVITKFSGLDMKTTLRVYTIATIFMGLTSLLAVYFLSLILL